MGRLLRQPLPWIVVSECVIVAALAMVAWQLVASPPSRQAPGVQAAYSAAQSSEAAMPSSHGAAGQSGPTLTGLSGLNVNASLWRSRLTDLNRGESAFQQIEWRLVHSAMNAARRYVESVVMPSLARAARGGR